MKTFNDFKVIEYNKAIYDHKDEYVFLYIVTVRKDLETNEYSYQIPGIFYLYEDGMYDYSFEHDFNYDYYLNNRFREKLHYLIRLNINDVYMDNIDEISSLKLFRYSALKESLEFIKNRKDSLNVEYLSINPIRYKEREFLYKLGLKSSAFLAPFEIEFKGTFEDTFGLTKDYLPFMIKHDMWPNEIQALSKYKIRDYRIIRFVSNIYNSRIQDMDIVALYKYKVKHKIKHMDDYFDYLGIAEEVGMNMTDKTVLYPDNFRQVHDAVVDMYENVNNKELNDKIINIGKLCEQNIYEDDNFIIIPAKDIQSFIDESRQMNNCVRTYTNRVANGECQIYFMRKKEDINKSFITIEVKDTKVVQARMKNNKDVSKKYQPIIDKFEKNLKSVKYN